MRSEIISNQDPAHQGLTEAENKASDETSAESCTATSASQAEQFASFGMG